MIDYLELHILNPDIKLLGNKLPIVSKNKEDGSLFYRSRKGQFGNLMVTAKPEVLIIKGSIHKYFNECTSHNRENASRFKYKELKDSLEWLTLEFGFKLNCAIVKKLECGFNLQMKKAPEEYLERIVGYIGNNGKTYRMSSTIYNNKLFMLCGKGHGITKKLYNKSEDVNMETQIRKMYKDLIRIEILLNRYADIKSFPKTAADLLDLNCLKKLSNLVRVFATQIIISKQLNIDYLYGKRIPNNIIKHLLLSLNNFPQLVQLISNTNLNARDKRNTITSLRKYMESISNLKFDEREMEKVEIIKTLDNEICSFFNNSL